MSERNTGYKKHSSADSQRLEAYINRCACNDTEAFSLLYQEASSPVFAFALSILKNRQDAEDVLHDCFVNVWNTAGKYRSSGKPMAWIMTIAKNLSLNLLKERKRRADMDQEDWERCTADCCALPTEDRLVLRACLFGLSDTERRILVLHAVSGFKHREIAAFLDIPLATVLSRYSRAVKKLRTILEKEIST